MIANAMCMCFLATATETELQLPISGYRYRYFQTAIWVAASWRIRSTGLTATIQVTGKGRRYRYIDHLYFRVFNISGSESED
ncbi:unnamed protein product [Acanthoscelides obtectus]|uniref:Uncharacterized protein n=1 Tax=Acanthoscelides obtectus TaxID=200917 RepID=A0A9P0LA90_ACAOB|nr:unnamed protein product [Acanthoscelides obtectus]CAK1663118.1 hypothetical protein AOBTE_LOCUS23488 [Acanthoscelides obtectus]